MTSIGFRRAAAAAVLQLATAVLSAGAANAADPPPAAAKPKTEGRPVYIAAGKVVVFPENVEEAPDEYRGALGARPLALIKLEGKVVGEIYASPLKKSAAEEAKGMAASAQEGGPVRLVKTETTKKGDDTVEVVTLKIETPSKLGNPWILHSLYFPMKESSTTFKLATAESRFAAMLPYLDELLWVKGADAKNK